MNLALFLWVLYLTLTPLPYSCRASWYQSGHVTANGERFRPDGLTAAHLAYPFGTKLRVTYQGRSVVARISDRGPYVPGRCIDLSRGTAKAIGFTGVHIVMLEKVL